MIFTDYTDKPTFNSGYTQQYRIQKYFRDLINNWFADSRNIKDDRLLSLMYTPQGKLSKDCVKTGVPFDPNGIYAGTTPAIIVSLGDISYVHKPINRAGNSAFTHNPTQPMNKQVRYKMIPINISVITQSYDGTVLLAQLLELFFVMNSQSIQADCNSLSYVNVQGVSAPQAIKPGSNGNAKQLYACNISITTSGTVGWVHDTQGPVFRGITVSTKNK